MSLRGGPLLSVSPGILGSNPMDINQRQGLNLNLEYPPRRSNGS